MPITQGFQPILNADCTMAQYVRPLWGEHCSQDASLDNTSYVMESVHPITWGWLTLTQDASYQWREVSPQIKDTTPDPLPRRVCWRSAAKPFQFLPYWLALSPEARQALPSQAIAIACASHSGMPEHTQWVSWWLEKALADVNHLKCGTHGPLGLQGLPEVAPLAITSLHHNCSGKHSAFLTWLYHMHAPETSQQTRQENILTEGFYPEAALSDWRQCIHTWLAKHTGFEPELARETLLWHQDGCGLPVPSSSFKWLTYAYHALWADPVTRPIIEAMAKHPELLAGNMGGNPRLDTRLMRQKASIPLVSKSGAEALVCVLRLDTGEVCVCKVWTGHQPTRDTVVPQVLQEVGWC